MSPTINSTEFTSGMKTLRRAKNFFSLLIILSLLVQIAGFIIIYFCGSKINATEIIYSQQSTLCGQECALSAILFWAFMVSKLLAMFSGCILVLILTFTSLFVIVGGGTGTKNFISTFLWSLLILVLVSPWQNILQGCLLNGALYSIAELQAAIVQLQPIAGEEIKLSFIQGVEFFSRFIGYPAVTIIVVILMLIKYSQGFKQLAGVAKEKSPTESSQI